MSVRRVVVCLTLLLFAFVAGAEAARQPGKAPKKDAVAGELIVRFERGASDAEQQRALASAGAKPVKTLGRKHTKLVRTDPATTEVALKILSAQPGVEYAELNYRVRATAVPNDPSFTQLWGLRNTGQTLNGIAGTADADIDADEAWNATTGSRGVTVAIIDTGVDFGHPELGGSMSTSPVMWTNAGESCTGCRTDGIDNDGNGYVDDWRGWDFVNNDNNPVDDQGHGTHVAGTIGALGNNGAGVTGVNWNVKIMALKFLDETGSGSTEGAVEAIRYATRMGVTASNNSWGGGEHSQALLDAIVEADAAGSLFVAAAGNASADNDLDDSFPADYDVPNVISVAATDQTDELADFSSYGASSVDLGAPGANIYSTVLRGGYDWYDGTSMATPHVTGVVALAKAAHPGATALGLKGLLLATVDSRSSLVGLVKSEGRLNAARAVGCAGGPQVWIDQPSAGFRAAVGNAIEIAAIAGSCGNPAGTTVSVTVNGKAVTLAARGDGLYTGSYTPASAGETTVGVTATSGAATTTRSVKGFVRENYRTVDGPYAWIDATAGGTKLTLGDDDSAVVALPFPFGHFDVSHSSVEISSNGYLMFAGLFGTSYMNSKIPEGGEPDSLIAAYWDDLNPNAGGAVWYRTVGVAPNRKFVVAWVGVPAFRSTNGVTFEAILEEGTNDVVLQYQDVNHGSASLNYGASATVGVEDDLGVSGHQFLFNQPLLQPYQGAKSLEFTMGTPATADTTPPAAPTGLAATPEDGQVTLDWADNGETDLAGYRVERQGAGGTWAAVATPMASTYTQTGLTNGTTYSYRVVALDDAGNASTPSAVASATPVADSNLLANGAFEGTTAGWVGWNATVSVVTGGNVGSAGRVALVGAAESFGVLATPMPVASTAAGSYSLGGWLRAQTGGRDVCIYLREWQAGSVVRHAQRCLAGADWQEVPAMTVRTAAGTRLDVVVIAWQAQPGDSFDLDGLTLTHNEPDANLLANGGFEGTTEGWAGWNASVSVVAGGRIGSSAGRVALVGSAASFGVLATPMPVPSTAAGSYSLGGWLRTQTGGRDVCIYLREWQAGTVVRHAQRCLTGAEWQELPPLSVRTAAGNSLDVVVIVWDAQPGDSLDLDGLALTHSPPADTTGGLLPNGGFEGTTDGWAGWNASVAAVAGGTVGSSAGRVALVGSAGSFGVLATPMPVASTVAGSYSLGGWLRAQTGGREVCLYLREWQDGTVVRHAHRCLAGTGEWQQWPELAVATAAGNSLDVVAIVWNAQPGDSFDLDGLTLTHTPAGA